METVFEWFESGLISNQIKNELEGFLNTLIRSLVEVIVVVVFDKIEDILIYLMTFHDFFVKTCHRFHEI
jgi:hypothetical protein